MVISLIPVLLRLIIVLLTLYTAILSLYSCVRNLIFFSKSLIQTICFSAFYLLNQVYRVKYLALYSKKELSSQG
jgi:hypothetical protein